MLDVLTAILPLSDNLKTLILYYVCISHVTQVQCFKNLEKLYLRKISFTAFDKEDTKVTKADLLRTVMKDMGMEGTTYEGVITLISLSKKVSKLYLNHIKHLPPEICDVILESMKNLSLVNFEFTHVDNQNVNPFLEIVPMPTVIVDKYTSAVKLFEISSSCTLG